MMYVNMNSLLMFLLAFIISICEINCIMISKTINGEQCMTDCVPYSDYHYCYLGWGARNWDKCTPGTEPSLQYYTAMYKDTKPLCTSLCGKFGYDYTWCFTGAGGAWDYCSEKPGYSVNYGLCTEPCIKYSTGYTCYIKTYYPPDFVVADVMVPLKRDIYDSCSPDPIDVSQFYPVSHAVEAITETHKDMYCMKRKKRLSENIVRTLGIDEIAARYERMYTPIVYNHPDVPINSFVRVPAPPIPGLMNVSLTVAIRATIYYRHINRPREAIPNYINYLMENMNALPGDERGHLLAASLGGATHDFNFAPQTGILNRNAGGDSFWYNIEGDMRRFLNTTRDGHIVWTLVVAYGDLQRSRRPTGFGLNCLLYDGNNVLVGDSGNCYFENHPSGGCPI